eukprot:TRINITY_DN46475_c0_g1_i1.p1 TRINITY_DN46475_c0_g1~~TRINITY_DN46475_c0_g1_i1.p1  ORF type:complete len:299 (-),score=25.73 TRINITY_DN46475_c0_g1_i1:225-1121(-)
MASTWRVARTLTMVPCIISPVVKSWMNQRTKPSRCDVDTSSLPTGAKRERKISDSAKDEKAFVDDTLKYARPRKPVVPQIGGGCFLEQELKYARAICCLRSPKGAQASGVLVRFRLHDRDRFAILTCHHVIPSQTAPGRECVFWQSSNEGSAHASLQLNPAKLIASNKSLDYALIEVDWHDGLPLPIELTLPRRQVFAGCAVRTMGFVRNMPLRCMYGVVSGTRRNKFYSTSAHEPGLSGAPLFVDGELAGIHTGFIDNTDEASHTHIGAILSNVYRESSDSEEAEDAHATGVSKSDE